MCWGSKAGTSIQDLSRSELLLWATGAPSCWGSLGNCTGHASELPHWAGRKPGNLSTNWLNVAQGALGVLQHPGGEEGRSTQVLVVGTCDVRRNCPQAAGEHKVS